MAFFKCGAVRLLVGVTPPGQPAQRGSTIYFQVNDIQRMFASLQGEGAQLMAEPTSSIEQPCQSFGWRSLLIRTGIRLAPSIREIYSKDRLTQI